MAKFPKRISGLYPNDPESEQTVLCALLNDPDNIFPLLDTFGLVEEWFFNEERKKVFIALKEMRDTKVPISLPSCTSWFTERSILLDSAFQLTALYTYVPTVLHVDHHLGEMKKQAAKRFGMVEAETAYLEISTSLEIQDVFDITTKAFEKTTKTCMEEEKEESHQDFMVKYLDILDERVKQKERKPGIIPPFPTMEKNSGLLRFGKLTVIVGHKGSGKSILGNQIVCDAAINHAHPGAIFSLEMPKEECVDRALAYTSRINLTNLTEGRLNKGEMDRTGIGVNSLHKAPLHFYDSYTTADGIESKMRSLNRKHGLKLGMVDYLQLLKTGTSQTRRDQDLTGVTTQFKRLAMELDMHIILIAASNKDGGIRESQGCEYDADNIWKMMLDSETEILHKIYVDKYRGSKAKYPIFVTPYFEYCRINESKSEPIE